MLSRTATLPAHSNRLAPVVASQASNPARRIPAADLRASTSSPLASTSRDVKSYAQMNAFPVPTWDSGRFYEEEMACLGDDCPKIVAQVISYEEDVLTASPSETLESIIPRLGNVFGLPVVDVTGRLTGLITRQDIINVRKTQGSMQATVADHMTSPVSSVYGWTTVQDAANIFLREKARVLPVVCENGYPVGLVSRCAIFNPLMLWEYQDFLEQEARALYGTPAVAVAQSGTSTSKAAKQVSWTLKYLYDGDCPMCSTLKAVLERQDKGRGIIKFVNIASDKYKPRNNLGITYDEAMETIHAIRSDGEVLTGTDALLSLFDSVGLGWATKLSELPVLAWLLDLLYDFVSANRQSMGNMGGLFDALIVSKRMAMSKQGIETCGDVDECSVEW